MRCLGKLCHSGGNRLSELSDLSGLGREVLEGVDKMLE